MLKAEIIAVGNEVTTGDIINTNTVYLSKKLTEMGFDVAYQWAVGDYPEKIKSVFTEAFSRSDIIVLTGGLGPTRDDLTKETVCEFFGLKMSVNEDSLNRMKAFFDMRKKVMTENNIKQALFPKNAIIFENKKGTADGCSIEQEGKCVILLPGPPVEMTAMFESGVAPYLAKKSEGVFASKTLKVFGLGESELTQKLDELFKSTDPVVATYVADGMIRIKITSTTGTKSECKKKCNDMAEKFRENLGNAVFGKDNETLQENVVKILQKKGLKISTAESCTGGLLSKMITEVSGSSEVFEYGICSYANRIKTEFLDVPEELIRQYGVVSEPVAEAMAKGVRQKGKADIGVGITGIAGPTGGTPNKPVGTVCISVYDGKNFLTRTIHASGDREKVRNFSALTALDFVRKIILNSDK